MACSRECPALDCTAAARVDFEPPFAEPGTYVVEVTLDGSPSTFSCTGTVPFQEADHCTDSRMLSLFGRGDAGNDVADGAPTNLAGFFLTGQRDVLALTVSRDGEVVLDREIDLTYRLVEINGPGCGRCPRAVERLVR